MNRHDIGACGVIAIKGVVIGLEIAADPGVTVVLSGAAVGGMVSEVSVAVDMGVVVATVVVNVLIVVVAAVGSKKEREIMERRIMVVRRYQVCYGILPGSLAINIRVTPAIVCAEPTLKANLSCNKKTQLK